MVLEAVEDIELIPDRLVIIGIAPAGIRRGTKRLDDGALMNNMSRKEADVKLIPDRLVIIGIAPAGIRSRMKRLDDGALMNNMSRKEAD